MAPEWYNVSTEQVTGHAGRLRGIADDVRQSLSAVDGVRVPGDGYGETGTRFTRILDGIVDEGVHTLNAAIVAFENSAKALKDSAEEYQRTEDANRQRLNRAGGRR